MMKLSASHGIMGAIPGTGEFFTPRESFTAMKKAGYDRVDVSLWSLCKPGRPLTGEHWEETIDELVAATEEAGLPVLQTHGNVLTGEQWDDPAYPDREFYHETVLRCIEGTKRLGASWMVLHPYNLAHAPLYNRQDNLRACVAFLAPYIEAAKKAGIGIAVENMIDFRRRHRRYCAGDVYELIELIDTINDPAVGICYDTGHGNISGMVPGEAIRAMGKRLVCTHINDNHAGRPEDEHLLPYFGNIDWTLVMKALHEIGYEGDFAYEIGSHTIPPEARDAWLRYTVEIGRKLLAMEV